ncbi:putative RING-H2 finger protein ATL21A [Malania oleifera]|uniref:putative RING-H2 finger protein ATL21A n=1 Tax=Malania oleifera TaxID=397392 RepID=UPI0025ADAB43|nr:putative RING-H2 finger protein ATL21A [Malania oleifera]
MGTLEAFFFLSFYSLSTANAGQPTCSTTSCHKTGLPVRFPFHLKKTSRPDRCGYPGFALSCNDRSQTVLTLPASGDFAVKRIHYASQTIRIADTDSCLPARILRLSLSGSPFKPVYTMNYTFLNCSSGAVLNSWLSWLVPVPCLSRPNHTVLVAPYKPVGNSGLEGCRRVATVPVPVQRAVYEYGRPSEIASADLQLRWDEPDCRACEEKRAICGFKSNSSLEIGCSGAPHSGLPRSAKYGIIIGVGIPGLVCLIGLACYSCSKLRAFGRPNHHLDPELSPALATPPPATVARGLDGPTIDSFPKMVLGDSRRMPERTSDGGACPICLSEYQPKETLRTIPECNHYFHANCIDEWLKMNATCPLCRNTPEGSSRVTSCSSSASPSSSLSPSSSP